MDAFTTTSPEVPRWTHGVVAEKASIGGLGPVAVGTPQQVADEMGRWIRVADLDGSDLAYVTTPGTFVEVDDLLVSELRRRGTYPEARDEEGPLTAWEKIYSKVQSGLRADRVGARYKYDVYKENVRSEQ